MKRNYYAPVHVSKDLHFQFKAYCCQNKTSMSAEAEKLIKGLIYSSDGLSREQVSALIQHFGSFDSALIFAFNSIKKAP